MKYCDKTTELLLAQCARYPALQIGDLFKALYQSIFGCGHLVGDPAAAADRIRAEALSAPLVSGGAVEPLGAAFCRVHLSFLQESGLQAQTLARLFALSAPTVAGDTETLQNSLQTLSALTEAGRLPFSPEEVRRQILLWQQDGFPACRHTEAFRTAYAPAYRVLRRDLAWALPLFAAIDRALAQSRPLRVAIEGGAGAGKSTLGALLAQVYDCNLFHMDDFFLRPEQRTAERYAQPGGNIDRERFSDEVLTPLLQGETVHYRRFDCASFTLQPPVAFPPKALTVVEGAYSCHPALADAYGLKVFLRIDPRLQEQRIRSRNTPEMQTLFFSRWLPLERIYFDTFEPQLRCDIVLEVTP